MTSRPGPGVYTISIRLGDHTKSTKSTQLNPPITELITITIETTTYLEKKTGEFPKWRNFFTLDIVSTGDAYAKCFRFFFSEIVTVMINW